MYINCPRYKRKLTQYPDYNFGVPEGYTKSWKKYKLLLTFLTQFCSDETSAKMPQETILWLNFDVNFERKWAVFLTSKEKLKIQFHPGD